MKLSVTNITIKNNKLTASIEPSSEHASQLAQEELKEDKTYIMDLSEEKIKRSNPQNKLLWALLTKLSQGINGPRARFADTWKIYIDMLTKYGTSIKVAVIPEARRDLARTFRSVLVIGHRQEGDKILDICQCVVGSSKYTTREFSLLVDGILDELAAQGIYDSEIAELTEEYKEMKTNSAKQRTS